MPFQRISSSVTLLRGLLQGISRNPLCGSFVRNHSDSPGVIVKMEPGRDSKKEDIENMRHKGRVVAMIAATQGIGLAICERVLQDGARVIVSSRTKSNVEYCIEYLYKLGYASDRVVGITGHGAHRAEIRQMFIEGKNHFGEIDHIYQGTGVNPGKWMPIVKLTDSIYYKLFESNVKCVWLACQEGYKYLDEKKHGSVILDSSVSAFQTLFGAKLGGYVVMKAIVLAMTKVMAEEMAPAGIRVNCIVPSTFDTKFATILTKDKVVFEGLSDEPHLKRVGQPHELGGLASFMFSDDASYMTAENVIVAGGNGSRL